MNFYTYLWLREDGTPYYVGKGIGGRAFTNKGRTVNRPSPDRILIQEFLSEEDALEAEKFLIAYYGRIDLGVGCLYNFTNGGDGMSGHIPTLATREKVRLAKLGKKRAPFSLEWRANLAKGGLGRIPTPETRKKLHLAQLGNTKNAGHTHSLETKNKMSVSGKLAYKEGRRNVVLQDSNGRFIKS